MPAMTFNNVAVVQNIKTQNLSPANSNNSPNNTINSNSSNLFMSPTHSSSNSSSQELLQQHKQQQRNIKIQQQKSPKKSSSLPGPVSPLMAQSPPSSKVRNIAKIKKNPYSRFR